MKMQDVDVLAHDLTQYMADYDPYEFADQFDTESGFEQSVSQIRQQLTDGYADEILEVLQSNLDESDHMVNETKVLLDRMNSFVGIQKKRTLRSAKVEQCIGSVETGDMSYDL